MRKVTQFTVSNRRKVEGFFGQGTEIFERKFDGEIAEVLDEGGQPIQSPAEPTPTAGDLEVDTTGRVPCPQVDVDDCSELVSPTYASGDCLRFVGSTLINYNGRFAGTSVDHGTATFSTRQSGWGNMTSFWRSPSSGDLNYGGASDVEQRSYDSFSIPLGKNTVRLRGNLYGTSFSADSVSSIICAVNWKLYKGSWNPASGGGPTAFNTGTLVASGVLDSSTATVLNLGSDAVWASTIDIEMAHDGTTNVQLYFVVDSPTGIDSGLCIARDGGNGFDLTPSSMVYIPTNSNFSLCYTAATPSYDTSGCSGSTTTVMATLDGGNYSVGAPIKYVIDVYVDGFLYLPDQYSAGSNYITFVDPPPGSPEVKVKFVVA